MPYVNTAMHLANHTFAPIEGVNPDELAPKLQASGSLVELAENLGLLDVLPQERRGELQAFKDAMEAGRPLLAGEQWSASPLSSLSPWDAELLPTLKEAEDALVAAALRHADGNQGVAAGLLGVSRQALNKRLRRRHPPPALPPA